MDEKLQEKVSVITESGGDLEIAAARLGVPVDELTEEVKSDPRLCPLVPALGSASSGSVPAFKEQLTGRQGLVNRMLEGYHGTGISDETLDKIKKLNANELDGAAFLVATLSMNQQMMSYHVLQMFQRMEKLAQQIDDPNTPEKMRITYQYLYNNMSDLLGKHHDRLLGATTAIYKVGRISRDQKKERPGFSTAIDIQAQE